MTEEGGGASRSTQPATGTSAATDVSLREHLAQRLHDAEIRIDERDRYLRDADQRFQEERDRRYTEVKNAEEKALRIKEQADRDALGLAREIQAYKDEKANELRAQIESERGIYLKRDEWLASHSSLIEKVEASLLPLQTYVTSAQGTPVMTTQTVLALVAVVGIIMGIIGHFVS